MKKFIFALFFISINTLNYSQNTLTRGDCKYSPVLSTSEPTIVSDTWAAVSGKFENAQGDALIKPPSNCNPDHAIRITVFWTTKVTDFDAITTSTWGSGGENWKFFSGISNCKTLYACAMPSFDFVIGDGGNNGNTPTQQLKPNTTYYFKFYFYEWQGGSNGKYSKLITLCPSPTYSFTTSSSSTFPNPTSISPALQNVCMDRLPVQLIGPLSNGSSYTWQYQINNGNWVNIPGQTEANYTPSKSPPDGSNAATVIYKRTDSQGNSQTATVVYSAGANYLTPYLTYVQTSNGVNLTVNSSASSLAKYTWQQKQPGGSWQTNSSSINTSLSLTNGSTNGFTEFKVLVQDGKCGITSSDIYNLTTNSLQTQIGTQIWMEKNLSPSTDNVMGGGLSYSATNWVSINTNKPAYCWYKNDSVSHPEWGVLYNWYSVTSNVCPTGWHVPSLDDWNTLINNVGGTIGNAGINLKQSGATAGWANNAASKNPYNFSALPSGFMTGGSLASDEFRAWTYMKDPSSNYSARQIQIFSNPTISAPSMVILNSSAGNYNVCGASIRCIKDK